MIYAIRYWGVHDDWNMHEEIPFAVNAHNIEARVYAITACAFLLTKVDSKECFIFFWLP